MKTFTTLSILLLSAVSFAQQDSAHHATYDLSLDLGVGLVSASAHVSLQRDWTIGKHDRLFVGGGIRTSMFTGRDVYFTSAPPSLAADQALQDSLRAPTPFIYDVNLLLQFGVDFTPRIRAGFNIDLLGVSFGPHGMPIFISDGVETEIQVRPTPINLLLVGANDRGSLTSQLFLRYSFHERWSAQLSFLTMINELTTKTPSQEDPISNNRFRSFQNQLAVGVVWRL